ncbi:MAG TPA: hypothetical protein VGD80_17345 [Kofleriaceae bacterium]
MTMPRGVTEIDRLIEQGLTLYGEGDLDGALLLWERVLVIDPENAQANSYVEYVRMNYELLTSDGNTEDSGPFGIGDGEPEYQIEILPGEDVAPATPAPLYMDARDEGWVIGEESGNGTSRAPDALFLELEADEPPPGGDPQTFETDKTGESVSFDDATREYPGGAGRPTSALLAHTHTPPASVEFEPLETPAFGNTGDFQTPQGFGSQTTDVRRRELGFVHPTDPELRVVPGPPELQIKLRTPPSQSIPLPRATPDVHRAPTANGDEDDLSEDEATIDGNREATLDLEPGEGDDAAEDAREAERSGASGAYESLDLDLSSSDPQITLDLVGRADTRPAVGDRAAGAEDLIASLPTPRAPASPTKPLPGTTRAPASDLTQTQETTAQDTRAGTGPPAGDAGKAQTQELPFTLLLDPFGAQLDPLHPAALTRDFAEKPTTEVRKLAAPGSDPMISAPTRELGLRELSQRPERRASTEDETTGQVDVQKLRAARVSSKPEVPPGMDPIDARSAEILEDIDRASPSPAQPAAPPFRAAIETREERTRRRITALLERAAEWARGSDLERAVTAVDLALSEDPNSALAQKLIHRNRDAIMSTFQAFLGDLQRTPALARPLHELGSAPISPRAAFLLSRVDGTLSLDEILDVSGMPRLEAYRYLCQLLLRGILR